MEYSEELSRKIVPSSWQCTNCKTCSLCRRPDPAEDEQMLFCDACDLGYHMPCHRPPVTAKPLGKWVCFRCNGGGGGSGKKRAAGGHRTSSTNSGEYRNGHGSDTVLSYDLDSDLSRFLPMVSSHPPIPPQLHPSSGLVPPNWEEFPVDPSIPDVSDWGAARVAQYMAEQGGVPQHLAEVFRREVRTKTAFS